MAPEGASYRLGIKLQTTGARLRTQPKVHLLEAAAPTMYFRYIESPDGNFQYPLFATEEEANYYHKTIAGVETGVSHTHTFADDPTGATWYMPDNGQMAGTGAPYSMVFDGQTAYFTEITSLTNADLAPPVYVWPDYTFEEGTAVNIQLAPVGASWTTTVSALPAGLAVNGRFIQGTPADVTGDVTTPVTVTRVNVYGSHSQTFDITISDTTPTTTMLTPWNKALDFSGSNEYAVTVNASQSTNPTRIAPAVTIAAPASGQTVNSGRPWATAIVFQPDGNGTNQHIWNQGEGSGSTDDNIYLRMDSLGTLYFGWGRQGSLNEVVIGNGFNSPAGTDEFTGVYIAHNGARFSSSDATAANLAEAFDIYIFRDNGGTWEMAGINGVFGDSTGNRSNVANWNRSGSNTGGNMGRSVDGYFSIGGRRANRSFHGKVASMVRTTLLNGVSMPDTTEVEMMITDPLQWVDTYKEGGQFRAPHTDAGVSNWDTATGTGRSRATQVWLMGDGTLDSYANGIRNQVLPTDQNDNKMQLNSMVSNDIENVNIEGLS
jgi:hypothetical protein